MAQGPSRFFSRTSAEESARSATVESATKSGKPFMFFGYLRRLYLRCLGFHLGYLRCLYFRIHLASFHLHLESCVAFIFIALTCTIGTMIACSCTLQTFTCLYDTSDSSRDTCIACALTSARSSTTRLLLFRNLNPEEVTACICIIYVQNSSNVSSDSPRRDLSFLMIKMTDNCFK